MSIAKVVQPQEAISQANQQFMSAFTQGNPGGVASCYTAGAQLFPVNMGQVTGRENIQGFWQAVMDMGIKAARLETVELDVLGETVIEVGEYTLMGGKEQVLDKGKYLVVWKTEQGQWKLHRDIWTTSLPAPSEK
jgi:ketosteroid isomerase-like protein